MLQPVYYELSKPRQSVTPLKYARK